MGETGWRPKTSGGEGAAIQAAPGRAPALGKGAVRTSVPRAGTRHRVGASGAGGAARRWEKVLFARGCRELALAMESARASLAGAREREAAASARVAEVETDLARLGIEQGQGDERAGV